VSSCASHYRGAPGLFGWHSQRAAEYASGTTMVTSPGWVVSGALTRGERRFYRPCRSAGMLSRQLKNGRGAVRRRHGPQPGRERPRRQPGRRRSKYPRTLSGTKTVRARRLWKALAKVRTHGASRCHAVKLSGPRTEGGQPAGRRALGRGGPGETVGASVNDSQHSCRGAGRRQSRVAPPFPAFGPGTRAESVSIGTSDGADVLACDLADRAIVARAGRLGPAAVPARDRCLVTKGSTSAEGSTIGKGRFVSDGS
jgi:hypothetical protein